MASVRPRSLVFWLAAVVPAVMLGALVVVQRIPAHALSRSVVLTGSWKIHDGDGALADPALDDSAWPAISLPGSYYDQGHRQPDGWLRKHFSAPGALVGRDAFLLLGGYRTGTAAVYLNGVAVGELNPGAGGLKSEVAGLDGLEVPRGLVRAGDNVVAIRYHVKLVSDDGFTDDRMLIGPRDSLRPYYVRYGDFRRVVQFGCLGILLFTLILFVSLASAHVRSEASAFYWVTIQLLVGAALSVAFFSGALPLRQDSTGGLLVEYLLPYVIAATVVPFFGFYFRGPRAWFPRLVTVIASVAAVATVALFALGQATRANLWIYIPFAFFAGAPVLYVSVLCVRAMVRPIREFDPVIGLAGMCFVVGAVWDLLGDLYLVPSIRATSFTLFVTAMIVSVVLIADFIRMSRRNQELTVSLGVLNQDLKVALTRAEESSRLKSEFVANMSHELRTPLNSVINVPEGLLELFQEVQGFACSSCRALFEADPGDRVAADTECPECHATGTLAPSQVWSLQAPADTVVHHLDQVRRAGSHLLSLVNDVLDFSKMEAGAVSLEIEALDVQELFRRVEDVLAPQAEQRKVRLSWQAPEPPLVLQVDAMKCVRILVNVVGNALKFSPEGSMITVKGRREPGGTCITVEDQGIGIAAENLEAIFEPFRQVDGSHTRKHGGTGIGLSISRKLAEAHGGRLWVESALGKGATFFVVLPDRAPSTPADPPVPEAERRASA